MRKIIVFNMMSLDGFFEGPSHDLSWHMVDEEFNQFAEEQIHSVEKILFGRVTYQMMADFWPRPEAIAADPVIAGLMNSMPKMVFSRTLERIDWQNTTLVQGDAVLKVRALKQTPGRDLIIFGSANLMSSLMNHNLIDEHRIMLNPVVLGKGIPLFQNLKGETKLKLIQTRRFNSGNVLLFYQPA
jgi:dihydrofolate reductase